MIIEFMTPVPPIDNPSDPASSTDPDEDALRERLALMTRLSVDARHITLPHFKNTIKADNKAAAGHSFDPVTQADKDTEALLRQMIRAEFAQDSIYGEEYPDHIGQNGFSWTLDPIDGTRAFIAGVPVWSTLIALSWHDRPIIGLIDVAAQDRRFWGYVTQTEQKAWLEHQGEMTTLKSRKITKLDQAILGCTEPLAMFNAQERRAYESIRKQARFSRLGLDAFAYGLVAQGRMDIVIEAMLKPCDVRALMPVIQGAGGAITNWEGGSAIDGGRVICVGTPQLLPQLYKSLAAQ